MKLVTKPHVLSIASVPTGAQIMIDSSGIGRVTPYDLELTAAQAAKPKLHVTLRKSGYRVGDVIVEASSFKDDDKRVVASVDATLVPAPAYVPVHNPPPTTTGTGSAGTGPVSSPDGSGSTTPANTGSATTPPSTDGSAAAPTTSTPPTGSASSGEPTPDFVKKQP